MRGTIYTLHYISSKGAMKCVWDTVSVHVSLHGISDCRCRYKVSANELCQRQLKTWWNGQWGDEKLALCSLGRCCIATPDSFGTLWLTCASRPKTEKKRKKKEIQASVASSVPYLRQCDLLELSFPFSKVFPTGSQCTRLDMEHGTKWY